MDKSFSELQNKLNQRVVKAIREDERKKTLEDVRKIIDECDPEPCCMGINKKELLNKLEKQ